MNHLDIWVLGYSHTLRLDEAVEGMTRLEARRAMFAGIERAITLGGDEDGLYVAQLCGRLSIREFQAKKIADTFGDAGVEVVFLT